jgi:hypothetical protein
MRKGSDLRTQIRKELSTNEGIQTTRQGGKTSSERRLWQIAHQTTTPANIKSAFDSFCAFHLGVEGAKLYKQHLQNLSNNISALLDSRPISSDLQISINFAYAVLRCNPQKQMTQTLALFSRTQKETAVLQLPRCIAFYLNSTTPVTSVDVANVLLEVADANGWTLQWLQERFAQIPEYYRAVTDTFGRTEPPPFRMTFVDPLIGMTVVTAQVEGISAPPVEMTVVTHQTEGISAPPPVEMTMMSPMNREQFGELRNEGPTLTVEEIRDVAEDFFA